MDTPPVVSQDEWSRARRRLQADEEELTRARDALAAKLRLHPWVRIEKGTGLKAPKV